MRIWNKPALIGALAIAIGVLGCETATEPERTSAPQPDRLVGDLLGSELSFAHRTIAQLSDEVVRKKIDPDVGGELTLLGHTLTVPVGAVDRPTMFVMSVLAGTEIQVELTAYDPDLYEDVGGKGFNIPVQLALSYAGADVDDPESLTIVHVETDGDKVVIDSEVDTASQLVTADLTHFSRYAMCGN